MRDSRIRVIDKQRFYEPLIWWDCADMDNCVESITASKPKPAYCCRRIRSWAWSITSPSISVNFALLALPGCVVGRTSCFTLTSLLWTLARPGSARLGPARPGSARWFGSRPVSAARRPPLHLRRRRHVASAHAERPSYYAPSLISSRSNDSGGNSPDTSYPPGANTIPSEWAALHHTFWVVASPNLWVGASYPQGRKIIPSAPGRKIIPSGWEHPTLRVHHTLWVSHLHVWNSPRLWIQYSFKLIPV